MLPITPPPSSSGTPWPADATQPRIDLQAIIATLCELGRVERLSDLGTKGPLVASAGADSLYHCLFGRDSIRMATDLLEDFPAVAQTTLVELARMQGIVDHDKREEEPGRILHACAVVGGFAEFFRGDSDMTPSVNTEIVDSYAEGFFNRLEQPPQANQGWTATRVWRILRQRGTIALD